MLWYSRTPKKTSLQAYIYIRPQVSPFLHSRKSRSRKKWRWMPPDPNLPRHRVAVPKLSSARPAGLLTGSTKKGGYPCRKAWAWAVPAFGSKPNFPFFCLRHVWLRKDFFYYYLFFSKGQENTLPEVHVLHKAAVETSQRKSVHFLFLVQRIYMLFLMIWAFSSG